jgi:hypothetical protein
LYLLAGGEEFLFSCHFFMVCSCQLEKMVVAAKPFDSSNVANKSVGFTGLAAVSLPLQPLE